MLPSIGWRYDKTLADNSSLQVQSYNITSRSESFKTDAHNVRIKAQEQCRSLIVFVNPNMPTGHKTSLSLIREIAQVSPLSTVLVDEAYLGLSEDIRSAIFQSFSPALST